MRTTLVFLLAVLIAGCSQSSQSVRTGARQKPAHVDEYAVLDDQTSGKPINDQVLNRKLEEVRRHYLLALRASHQHNDAAASQHFEAAISTLNDLVTYPNIQSHPEFEKLSESVIQDYEAQITSLDSLDQNSSFFVLRDKIFQEIESIPVERKQYPKNDPVTGPAEETDLQIALPENEAVQQCITFFTSEKGRRIFSAWLARTGRYFPMYEQVMVDEKVPLELKHLSMIESGLKPTAVSWAKAVGLWQFIPSTGKEYGMDINWWVDERRDPEISTHAAARYLRDLYQDLGDWHLALASYNCGPGRVKSAIAKANSRDYWVIRNYLPRETQQYVPLYIAATIITMNPEKYGFTDIVHERPDEFDTVTVKSDYDLATIAKVGGTTVERIRELNPSLLRDALPQGASHFRLRMPRGTPVEFSANLEQIPVPERPQIKWLTHKVGRGESITAIAKRYNTPVADIYAANKMTPKSKLRRGAKLRVPVKIETRREETTIAAKGPEMEPREPYGPAQMASATPPAAKTPATPPVTVAAKTPTTTAPTVVEKAPAKSPVTVAEKTPTVAAEKAPAVKSPVTVTEKAPGVAAVQTPARSPVTVTEKPAAAKSPVTVAEKAPVVAEKSVPARSPVTVAAATPPSPSIAERTPIAASPARSASGSIGDRGNIAKRTDDEPAASDEAALFAEYDEDDIADDEPIEEEVVTVTPSRKAPQFADASSGTKAETVVGRRTVLDPTIVGPPAPSILVEHPAPAAGRSMASADKPATKQAGRKAPKVTTHTVKRGESLTAIADSYRVTIADLAEWNGLDRKANVMVGQKLSVHGPAKGVVAAGEKGSKRRSVTTTSSGYEMHKVRPGESLTEIADRYGVAVNDLKAWNPKGVNGTTIQAGDKLKIYNETPSKGDARKSSRASKSAAKMYKVRRGDTLAEIADKFGVSVSELRRNNPKVSERNLKAGQTIRIKK